MQQHFRMMLRVQYSYALAAFFKAIYDHKPQQHSHQCGDATNEKNEMNKNWSEMENPEANIVRS